MLVWKERKADAAFIRPRYWDRGNMFNEMLDSNNNINIHWFL